MATAANAAAPASAAALAKAAFRRLAQAQLEPTPENYARAYAEEAGQPPPGASAAATAAADTAQADAELKAQGQAWVTLCDRLARNLERGGKQWTAARRKDSLQRVFTSSRSDPQRLLQRLQSLMGAWESDQPSDPAETGVEAPPLEAVVRAPGEQENAPWAPLVHSLQTTVQAGLPSTEARAVQLADRLGALADRVAAEGVTPERLADLEEVCDTVRRLFGHRHHLVQALGALCRELGAGLAELSEDDSWVQGQCRILQAHLGLDPEMPLAEMAATELELPSVRGVRAARTVLAETRQAQQRVHDERASARDALKQMLHNMLLEVGEIGVHTGRFQLATARHVQAIAEADTLQGLAGVVHALLDDARTVQVAVDRSQQRLLADHTRAEELEARVRELEVELRRLSEEVSTDALTQVANRRGLMLAFESEVARQARASAAPGAVDRPGLAVALIDIDNFKRINDTLGHAAGDLALQRLSAAVRERLRPGDHLARFGGEEFVVLLPSTVVEEAQQVLTRLQRSLTEALFLHDGREVFVTFSGGVTSWRVGEALQLALERADEALYEAKRTGKNRTCIG